MNPQPDQSKKMNKKIKYPADRLVHWATGPVPCCEKHGNQLITLGNFLGTHVVATKLDEPAECKNCVNEEAADEV